MHPINFFFACLLLFLLAAGLRALLRLVIPAYRRIDRLDCGIAENCPRFGKSVGV